jgi:hypothetical protein
LLCFSLLPFVERVNAWPSSLGWHTVEESAQTNDIEDRTIQVRVMLAGLDQLTHPLAASTMRATLCAAGQPVGNVLKGIQDVHSLC